MYSSYLQEKLGRRPREPVATTRTVAPPKFGPSTFLEKNIGWQPPIPDWLKGIWGVGTVTAPEPSTPSWLARLAETPLGRAFGAIPGALPEIAAGSAVPIVSPPKAEATDRELAEWTARWKAGLGPEGQEFTEAQKAIMAQRAEELEKGKLAFDTRERLWRRDMEAQRLLLKYHFPGPPEALPRPPDGGDQSWWGGGGGGGYTPQKAASRWWLNLSKWNI